MPTMRKPKRAALLAMCISLISACALLKTPIPLTQLQLTLDAEKVSPEGDTEKRVSPEGDTEKRVSPEGDTEKRVSPEGDTEKKVSWPSGMLLGSVQSRAVLKTDRIIVTRGALVMQHEGLRWTSAPEILIAEQLGILAMLKTAPNSARVDPVSTPQLRAAPPQKTCLPCRSGETCMPCRSGETCMPCRSGETCMPCRSRKTASRLDVWLNEFNVAVMPDSTSVATVSAAATVQCSDRGSRQLPLVRATLPLNSSDPQRVANRFSEAATRVLMQLLNSAAKSCELR